MEQHETNGRDGEGDDAREAWSKVTDEFSALGGKVRTFFEHDEDDSTSAEDAHEAIQDFVASAERAGRSVAAAFRDPEVQQQVKGALGSLIEAIGATARDVSDQVSGAGSDTDEDS